MKELPKTICAHPWQHLHSWPDGKAMLCCVAHGGDKHGAVGDFSVNSYEEIMNSDKMNQIRKDFLNGEKPVECSACWKAEELGKSSFRLDIGLSDEVRDLMERTSDNGELPETKMYYMDYRFSNLCNLGCQTCGSPLSSTIANKRENNESENSILRDRGVLSERGTVTSFVYARPDFMEVDVYPYLDDCRSFYFAGGEPLMHQEHLDILNYLNDNKLYNKHIMYSTNLSILSWKGNDFIDIWKNFSNLMFWCSVDAHGPALEYVREYSNHDTIFKNLQKLLDAKKDHPQMKINICCTHSVYNAYCFPEFIDFLYEQGFLQLLDDIEINYAFGDLNSPAILPNFAKKELKEKRALCRNNESIQYAMQKFDKFEYYYDTVDSVIDEPSQKRVWDDLVSKKLIKDMKKLENSLPWLHSVVERYRIV